MHSTSLRLKLILSMLLSLGLSFVASAADYPFPASEPAFTVSFPEHWVMGGRNGNITSRSPDKTAGFFLWKPDLAQMSTVVSNAQRHASPVLSKFEQVGQVIYRKRAGIQFQCVYGKGVLKQDGRAVDVAMAFFASKSGTVYGAARVSTEIGKEINSGEIAGIVNSIRPYVGR